MRRALRLAALLAATLLALAVPVQVRSAPKADSDDYDRLVLQARALLDDGNSLAAFCDYIDAYSARPDAAEAAQALADWLRSGNLPVHVPEAELAKLAQASGPIYALSMPDQNLVALASRTEMPAVTDPQNGWPFTRVMWFYRATDRVGGDLTCLAAVRFQTGDDAMLAQRTGRLLSVLRSALYERTGYLPLCDGVPFTVWLCRHATDAGGEQWRNNIYFYDIADQRSSIEWIREIAHEYSHMALPLIGGDYTEPEPWANGYYGERLLLRWIARGAAGGPTALEKAWGGTFSGYVNYDALRIEPCLALFNRHGVDSALLARRDATGMDYLFGMLLKVDDQAGPRALADLLWNLPQGGLVDPAQLVSGVRAALARGPRAASGKRRTS